MKTIEGERPVGVPGLPIFRNSPSPASRAPPRPRRRDVVAQHFALATTAHMAQWMLSGLEVNPSLAIARMRVLMTDQTTPGSGPSSPMR